MQSATCAQRVQCDKNDKMRGEKCIYGFGSFRFGEYDTVVSSVFHHIHLCTNQINNNRNRQEMFALLLYVDFMKSIG